jgi:hypothetical protein
MAVSGQDLVVSGTATEDGDQGVACVMANVTLTSLAISRVIEPRCDDPRRLAAPIEAVQQTAPSMQTSVRIARIDPKTGHLELGPVVVTYTEISDSHLEVAQGPGYLWLYAPITPKGAQALRISDATGAVLQDTTISPAMDRPLIAANADGLFLAQAGNSAFLEQSAPTSANDVAIFRLGVGASNVEPFDVPNNPTFQGFASWMTGSGTSLWADICARPISTVTCKITRFDGTEGKPVYAVTDPVGDGGLGWVVGNAATGLYSTAPIGSGETTSYRIVRIAPDTGAVSTLATLTLPAFYRGIAGSGAGEAVVADGALYLLAPPTGPAGGSLPGRLYRVALGGTT